MWQVCRGSVWIGIVETNYAWAVKYWRPRGFNLRPHNG